MINENLEKIQNALNSNIIDIEFNEKQFQVLEICETLLESYTIIQDEIRDIEDSITFSRLSILHPSIIKPSELVNQLSNIARLLQHNNLPLYPNVDSLPTMINLITLQSFITSNRIVFVLRIPLVTKDTFTAYHLYSIPTKNPKSNAFHAIIPESKYIAVSSDHRQYIYIESLQNCKQVESKLSLCENLTPLTLQKPNCEIEVITKLTAKSCNPVHITFEDYNIIRLKRNKWIVIVSSPIPVVSSCQEKLSKTQLVEENSILYMEPKCSAYIGATQIYAEEEKSSNTTEDDIIPQIPYDCCEYNEMKPPAVVLSPIHIKKLNMDELDIATQQLKEQERILNEMHNQSFASRHLGTFTIITIIIIVLLILYCCCCRRRRNLFQRCSPSPRDSPNCCVQFINSLKVVNRRNDFSNEDIVISSTNAPAERCNRAPSPTSRKPIRKF